MSATLPCQAAFSPNSYPELRLKKENNRKNSRFKVVAIEELTPISSLLFHNGYDRLGNIQTGHDFKASFKILSILFA